MANATSVSALAAKQAADQSVIELRLLDVQAKAMTEQAVLSRISLARGSMPLLIPVSRNDHEILSDVTESSVNPTINLTESLE